MQLILADQCGDFVLGKMFPMGLAKGNPLLS
jgi:hypothetical protein